MKKEITITVKEIDDKKYYIINGEEYLKEELDEVANDVSNSYNFDAYWDYEEALLAVMQAQDIEIDSDVYWDDIENKIALKENWLDAFEDYITTTGETSYDSQTDIIQDFIKTEEGEKAFNDYIKASDGEKLSDYLNSHFECTIVE